MDKPQKWKKTHRNQMHRRKFDPINTWIGSLQCLVLWALLHMDKKGIQIYIPFEKESDDDVQDVTLEERYRQGKKREWGDWPGLMIVWMQLFKNSIKEDRNWL